MKNRKHNKRTYFVEGINLERVSSLFDNEIEVVHSFDKENIVKIDNKAFFISDSGLLTNDYDLIRSLMTKIENIHIETI